MRTANEVFRQNNGDVTKQYYADLAAMGPAGEVGVALFRAQKRSTAAKRYRRGADRSAAYDVKNWSMGEVCRLLTNHAQAIGISWGWKADANTLGFEHVLYVDLPNGQCSFHSPVRLNGPDYPGVWDGQHLSGARIIHFCDSVVCNFYRDPEPVQITIAEAQT